MILSKFRRKKTTIEILEDLDKNIREIERYGHTTEQRRKKIIGTLFLYSILYIITAFIFYFYFFPASLYDQIFYIIPLLIFPILILLTKKIVTWYYKRKISENEEKLSTMLIEKQRILDEVTETETYKKAKEILLKYAPDKLNVTPLSPQPPFRVSTPVETSPNVKSSIPQNVISPLPSSGELRRRVVASQNQLLNVQSGMPTNTGLVPIGTAPIRNTPITPFQSGVKPVTNPAMAYRSFLPRPVLPHQRSAFDRLVDYIVGDGPSNRYALICKNCESHNGMALKEEFEYFGYRCCYCNFWNPARKQKPTTPKLTVTSYFSPSPSNTPEHLPAIANTESMKLVQMELPSSSDTDSDIEVVERSTEILEDADDMTKQIKKECDESDTEKVNEKKETNKEEANQCDKGEKMDVDESFS